MTENRSSFHCSSASSPGDCGSSAPENAGSGAGDDATNSVVIHATIDSPVSYAADAYPAASCGGSAHDIGEDVMPKRAPRLRADAELLFLKNRRDLFTGPPSEPLYANTPRSPVAWGSPGEAQAQQPEFNANIVDHCGQETLTSAEYDGKSLENGEVLRDTSLPVETESVSFFSDFQAFLQYLACERRNLRRELLSLADVIETGRCNDVRLAEFLFMEKRQRYREFEELRRFLLREKLERNEQADCNWYIRFSDVANNEGDSCSTADRRIEQVAQFVAAHGAQDSSICSEPHELFSSKRSDGMDCGWPQASSRGDGEDVGSEGGNDGPRAPDPEPIAEFPATKKPDVVSTASPHIVSGDILFRPKYDTVTKARLSVLMSELDISGGSEMSEQAVMPPKTQGEVREDSVSSTHLGGWEASRVVFSGDIAQDELATTHKKTMKLEAEETSHYISSPAPAAAAMIRPNDLPPGMLQDTYGDMVYDKVNMRWVKLHPDEEETDPFEDLDGKDGVQNTADTGDHTKGLSMAFESLECIVADLSVLDTAPQKTPAKKIRHLPEPQPTPYIPQAPPIPLPPATPWSACSRPEALGDHTLERDREVIRRRLLELEPCEDAWPALKEVDLRDLDISHVNGVAELLGESPQQDRSTTCLESVQLNGNRLSYLTGLPASLVKLRVSANCLTKVTGYGHLPNLQELDVSRNLVEDLTGLSCLRHLRDLRADSVGISDLTWLGNIPSLIRVSLRGNRIRRICIFSSSAESARKVSSGLRPWRALSLQYLDLSHNQITCLEGVDKAVCPALVNLTIDHNLIASVSLKRPLSKLRTLRMNHNPFRGPFDLAFFPSLRVLNFDACELPMTSYAVSTGDYKKGISRTVGDGGGSSKVLLNAHKSKLEQLTLRAQRDHASKPIAHMRTAPLLELQPLLCSTLTKLYLSGNPGADIVLAKFVLRHPHSARSSKTPMNPSQRPVIGPAVVRMEALTVLELCGLDMDDNRLRDLFSPSPSLHSCFPRLRVLNLSFNPRLRDLRALCVRPGLPRLYRLVAIACGVRDPTVAADLHAACRYLRYIDLRQNSFVNQLTEDEECQGEADDGGDQARKPEGESSGGDGMEDARRKKAMLYDGPVPTTAHITGMEPYPSHGMALVIA